MSSPVTNGANSETKHGSRIARRKEWWNKNKEFKSKLRDRSTLKTEKQMQIHIPKIEASRGFRSAIVNKLVADITRHGKQNVNSQKNMQQSKPKTKTAGFSSKSQTKPDKVNEKKPKVVSKTSASKTEVDQKLSRYKTSAPRPEGDPVQDAPKPEMSEISMNARGVEVSSGVNHIPQRYILFIGNLPYSIDKGQLMVHFRKTGGVKHIRIPKDKSGKGKGFAYIEFKDRISHGIALRLHHTTLGGRRINVEFSTSTSESKQKREENREES